MRKITVTTMILSKLHRKNQKIVTGVEPLPGGTRWLTADPSAGPQDDNRVFSVGCGFCQLLRLMKLQCAQRWTIAAQGAGGKQAVVRGRNQVGVRLGEGRHGDEARLGGYIV